MGFDRTDCQVALRGNLRDGFSGFEEVEADLLRIGLGKLWRLCGDVIFGAVSSDDADKIRAKALLFASADAGYLPQRDMISGQKPYQLLQRARRQDFVKRSIEFLGHG